MTPEDTVKEVLLRKYVQGLEEIWKRLIDQGPDEGNPLDLFEPALALTEKSIAKLLE